MAHWNNCGSSVMGDQFNLLRAEVADLRTKLTAAVVDAAAARTALNALVTKHNALLAKLDADAGVTDADYAATQAGVAQGALTATAPSAATTEAITRS